MLMIGAKILGMFGVGDDLAKKFSLVPLLAIGGLLLWGGIELVDRLHENTIETAEEAGAAKAVAAGQEATLEQVKDAKDAADKIRNDVGFARYCQCVRDAAKGFDGHCQREIKDKSLFDDVETPSATCSDPSNRP